MKFGQTVARQPAILNRAEARAAAKVIAAKTREDDDRAPRQSASLIELLVVIGIIAIVSGLLLPALARAKQRGKQANEINAARQLMLSWQIYADDNEDRVLPGYTSSAPAFDDRGNELGSPIRDRYPWRLAPTLANHFHVIYVNESRGFLEKSKPTTARPQSNTRKFSVNLRRLNSGLHRDIGYFLSGLVFIYCISGIALNHVNDWNADFETTKRTIPIHKAYTKDEITDERVAECTALVGESEPRVHDFPTSNHVKIYYDNAALLVDLPGKTGTYEKVQRRPFIYQTNVLHRNSLKGWKWASDVFGVLLIFMTASGWFMLKGKNGVMGRGKWFIAAGILPPVVALIIFDLLQK